MDNIITEDLINISLKYPNSTHPLLNFKPRYRYSYVIVFSYIFSTFYEINYKPKNLFYSFISNFIPQDITTQATEKEFILHSRKLFKKFLFFKNKELIELFIYDYLFLFARDNETLTSCDEEIFSKLFGKRYLLKIQVLFSAIWHLEKEKLFVVDEEMLDNLKKINNYRVSNIKKVIFTAIMSSGKSTLINSIIGEKITPVKNKVCTSRVISFCNLPFNSNEVRILGKSKQMFKSELLDLLKKDEQITDVALHFNSEYITGKTVLIDTPGVDSCLYPQHKKITQEKLLEKDYDLIVFVLASEAYENEANYVHLKFVKKNIPDKKIIFVLNKIDECSNEDDSLKDIVNELRIHLQTIGFEDPIICPVSGKGILEYKTFQMENNNDKNLKREEFFTRIKNLNFDYENYSNDEIFNKIGFTQFEMKIKELLGDK